MKILSTLLASLLLGSVSISAQASRNLDYQAGGQYSAVLDRESSQWHMIPRVRQDFAMPQNNDCQSNTTIPAGLWLLTHDANGRPELLAPSHTPLPKGHSGHIPIISCTDKHSVGLAIPAKLIEWLSQNTGAIYVE